MIPGKTFTNGRCAQEKGKEAHGRSQIKRGSTWRGLRDSSGGCCFWRTVGNSIWWISFPLLDAFGQPVDAFGPTNHNSFFGPTKASHGWSKRTCFCPPSVCQRLKETGSSCPKERLLDPDPSTVSHKFLDSSFLFSFSLPETTHGWQLDLDHKD